MDDPKKTPPDEYQFPSDEYITEPETHPLDEDSTQTKSNAASTTTSFSRRDWINNISQKMPFLKNKRILLVIAGIIILFIVIHLFSNKTPDTTTAPPLTSTIPTQPEEISPLNEPSLQSLKSHSDKLESQVSELRSELTDMQSTMNQTQSENQQLRQSISQLSTQVNQLTIALSQLSKIKTQKSTPRITFHLRAVLPDRAWLTSRGGKSLTVTIGDHIPQYGTVTAIDSRNGIVETSSGRKIEYGVNDY